MASNKRITIKVGDKEYPCYPTMGATVGFNDLTGREVEDIHGTSDVVRFIYCCVKSAANREGLDFGMSLEDFADNVLTEDLNAASAELMVGDGGDAKKKD